LSLVGFAPERLVLELTEHVAVADLNVEGAEAVAEEISATRGERRAIGVAVDVADEAAVVAAMRRTVIAYGGLHILVCSAGISTSAPFAEQSLEDWERNYAILARGYFLASREAFRALLEQGRGGAIVFVGSKNALVAGKNAAAYSSAKAASLHLARCLAEEGGAHGIRVNTVNPDAVIEGSSIWSSEWKAARAKTYDISEEELPAYYRKRTTLVRQRLPGGRRRGDRVPRRAALDQVNRQRRQRRRRRGSGLSALTCASHCSPRASTTRSIRQLVSRCRWSWFKNETILIGGAACLEKEVEGCS